MYARFPWFNLRLHQALLKDNQPEDMLTPFFYACVKYYNLNPIDYLL